MADDNTSQGNFHQITSTHLEIEWSIDFEAKLIAGSAKHTVVANVHDVSEFILDTSALEIHAVEVNGEPAKYTLGDKHEVMGSALTITLPSALAKGASATVFIKYNTTKGCTAVGWLAKEQTQGKQFPYLFTQCQPIYARSLVPCQDSPSVKITYTAKVTSVLPALMSANRVSPPSDGPPHDGKVIGKDAVTYAYNQPVPIPPYLIALAAGNVVYRPFPKVEGKDWTTGIWSEPELIEAAYWEFSEDTNKLQAIVPPYRFGVYDLLVLPPAFPYGGMENACLTFLTPTLLAGDRTLVDVIAHELTHSWFGNGVTQANSSHFWLNEGFTTYIERVLLQKLHSPAERGFSYLIGWKGLQDDLKFFEARPKYQRLVIEFEKGEDPDDAYSRVPYDKGANFLLYLEQTLGGLDVFLKYINDYVSTFMGKSITTDQWKAHLYEYFTQNYGDEKVKALDSVDWNAWLYGEGTELPVKLEYDLTLAEQAYDLAKRWDASRNVEISQLNFKDSDLKDFNSNQKVVFLERLQIYDPLPATHITHLGTLYALSSTPNAEVRQRFYEVALQDSSSPEAKTFAAEAAKWVVGKDGSGVIKGRMKFCRPTFREVAKADRELAVKTFEEHKEEFHPIAQRLIEKDLGLV
ncbi:peptidase family M1-domain-containing protein [Cristinia sonorae]|uniref:Peptidase family M1-domain-containing protein n=1 Tax=Cristinia sonorae TaxID=1940300 RepID=A0A8K0USA3_9AGAR|nr:peptidase family M1-domain-containing protein [Cristinia sonorae]